MYGLLIIGLLIGIMFPEVRDARVDAVLAGGSLTGVSDLASSVWPLAAVVLFNNVLVASLAVIVLPSLVIPFAGIALFAISLVDTGILLAPVDAEAAWALLPHSVVLLVEFQAYVLLIFGVMLTAQTGFVSMKTSGSEWILATIVGGSLLMLLMQACWNVPDWAGQPEAAALVQPVDAHATTGIGLSIIGVRPDRLDARKTRLQSGMSGYLLPFEIISVHLLIVLVGAAYLARSKRQVPSRE